MSGEKVMENYIDLVKDFTALVILVDLDNNLRPTDLNLSIDNHAFDDKTLRFMLKSHKKFLKD